MSTVFAARKHCVGLIGMTMCDSGFPIPFVITKGRSDVRIQVSCASECHDTPPHIDEVDAHPFARDGTLKHHCPLALDEALSSKLLVVIAGITRKRELRKFLHQSGRDSGAKRF
jgi:hypothetical protein